MRFKKYTIFTINSKISLFDAHHVLWFFVWDQCVRVPGEILRPFLLQSDHDFFQAAAHSLTFNTTSGRPARI
jgi:hypothetical protein